MTVTLTAWKRKHGQSSEMLGDSRVTNCGYSDVEFAMRSYRDDLLQRIGPPPPDHVYRITAEWETLDFDGNRFRYECELLVDADTVRRLQRLSA
jgi:hypothetical protein